MPTSRTCGKCKFFLKANWNDSPGDIHFGRNGICDKYDYNVVSDGSYAVSCDGYSGKRYNRDKANRQQHQPE